MGAIRIGAVPASAWDTPDVAGGALIVALGVQACPRSRMDCAEMVVHVGNGNQWPKAELAPGSGPGADSAILQDRKIGGREPHGRSCLGILGRSWRGRRA